MATGFGVGYAPSAPGTAGSLLGVGIYLLLQTFAPRSYGWVLLFGIVIGLYVAGRAERALGRIDPPQVVIDEVLGMMLTLFLLPMGSLTLLLGFAFFRLFDIGKPPPLRWIQRWPGGFGIVMDDLAAAGYAHLLTRWVLGWIG